MDTKNNSKRYSYFIFTILLLGILIPIINSCSENDCSITRRPASRFVFMDSATGQEVSLFDSLTVSAVKSSDSDTILLNKVRAVNYISLPLSYTDSTTVFILQYFEEYRDTIWVNHKNIPFFISMECGRDMFFEITSYDFTQHILDQVILTDPDIRDHEKENFQIFFTLTE